MRLNAHTLKFDTYDIKEPIHFGGFAWNLDFLGKFVCYIMIGKYNKINLGIGIGGFERNNPLPPWNPKPCPIVYGSTHAIRKDFFIKLGKLESF